MSSTPPCGGPPRRPLGADSVPLEEASEPRTQIVGAGQEPLADHDIAGSRSTCRRSVLAGAGSHGRHGCIARRDHRDRRPRSFLRRLDRATPEWRTSRHHVGQPRPRNPSQRLNLVAPRKRGVSRGDLCRHRAAYLPPRALAPGNLPIHLRRASGDGRRTACRDRARDLGKLVVVTHPWDGFG